MGEGEAFKASGVGGDHAQGCILYGEALRWLKWLVPERRQCSQTPEGYEVDLGVGLGVLAVVRCG
jgi:hypothetical protein